jgi:hypothetical protein
MPDVIECSSPLGMTATAEAVRLVHFPERSPTSVQERILVCKFHACVVGGHSFRRGAAAVRRIGREPAATLGVSPKMLASGCIALGSVRGVASVGLESAMPNEASRPLMPIPEVGGGLSYIWGRGVVRIASAGSPQLGTIFTALPPPSASWHGPMRR